ncbi:hypothetical protein [Nocardioides sp. SYSU DS0663]|uniref:hypothetical protein n=1 Tax=Nocardioides sp. SYSU DS0663 TaxID=3416445 RepID=UPI003F4BA00A
MDMTRLRVIDPFLAIAALAGTVLPIVFVLSGHVDVGFRALASDDLAVRSQLALLVFVAGTVWGWHGLAPKLGRGLRVPVTWPPSSAGFLILSLGLFGLAVRLAGGKESGSVTSAIVDIPPLLGLFGTLLTPLTAAGAFLLIGRSASVSGAVVKSAALIPIVVYALGTFSLNRAVFVVPFMSAILVLVRMGRVRRLGTWLTASAVGILVFFVSVGQARQEQLGGAGAEALGFFATLERSLFVYFQSPHLVGVAYSQPDWFDLRSLSASLFAPIPTFGEGFRGSAGADHYNYIIYGGAANDQILPLWAELDLSVGLIPLLLFAVLFGRLLRQLENRMSAESSALQLYVASFVSLWLAQAPIVSLSVLSQIACYFVLPLLIVSRMVGQGALRSDANGVAPPVRAR